MAVLVWYLLFRTTFGYQLRTVGLSKGAAAYAGMSWGATITIAMFISGALGGLGGSSETLGLLGQQYNAPPGIRLRLDRSRAGRTQQSVRGRARRVALRHACVAARPPCRTRPAHRKSWCWCCRVLSFLSFAALAASGRMQAWWAKRRGTRFEDISDTIGVEPGVQPEL